MGTGIEEGVFLRFSRQGDLESTETWHRGELVEDAPEAVVLDLRKTFHANGAVSRSGPGGMIRPWEPIGSSMRRGIWWRSRSFVTGCFRRPAC